MFTVRYEGYDEFDIIIHYYKFLDYNTYVNYYKPSSMNIEYSLYSIRKLLKNSSLFGTLNLSNDASLLRGEFDYTIQSSYNIDLLKKYDVDINEELEKEQPRYYLNFLEMIKKKGYNFAKLVAVLIYEGITNSIKLYTYFSDVDLMDEKNRRIFHLAKPWHNLDDPLRERSYYDRKVFHISYDMRNYYNFSNVTIY
ncbi:MAG: hypothetical protein JZD41_02545 [Thermoproteus sp.]|nr:hypothetical protein [Thermoproteus sp.]